MDRVLSVGKNTVYVLTDPRGGRGKKIVGLDGDNGKEKFDLDVAHFNFVPSTLTGVPGQKKDRSLIYLIHKNGLIQAIGENQ